MVATSLVIAPPKPRLLRPLVARGVAELPFISTFVARCGGVVGLMENALPLLQSGQLLLIFPEGVARLCKPCSPRYRLQRFNVRSRELALAGNAPPRPV